jgi:hypothetical protein
VSVEGMKTCRGRLKIKLIEVIKNYMLIKNITENMISNKIKWSKRIQVTDLDSFLENP